MNSLSFSTDKYGLKEKTIKAIQTVFSRYPQIHQAVLYGSRAKGNYKNGSDIDLTLQGDSLDSRAFALIENDLEELLLPYKIDLSLYHDIDSSELIDHIQRRGIVFYSR